MTPGTTLRPLGIYDYLLTVERVTQHAAGIRLECRARSASTGERHAGHCYIGPLAPADQPGLWRDARRWPHGRWGCVPEFYRVETPAPLACGAIGITGDLFA